MRYLVLFLFVMIANVEARPLEQVCTDTTIVWRKAQKEHWNTPYYDKRDNTIVLIEEYMDNLSEKAQKFVFQHECGHAHGIRDETLADKYAYDELTKQNIDIDNLTISELCHDHQDAKRCESLLRRYK